MLKYLLLFLVLVLFACAFGYMMDRDTEGQETEPLL